MPSSDPLTASDLDPDPLTASDLDPKPGLTEIAVTAVVAVLAFTVIFALGWAIASGVVFLGLNAIGGFGLSFSQVIGIGAVVAYLAVGKIDK